MSPSMGGDPRARLRPESARGLLGKPARLKGSRPQLGGVGGQATWSHGRALQNPFVPAPVGLRPAKAPARGVLIGPCRREASGFLDARVPQGTAKNVSMVQSL